jgi:transcriptional regulator with XRE-family HTH domain
MNQTTQEMMNQIRAQLAPESKQFIDKNLAISARLQEMLDKQGITQKQLAQRMALKESQVSRWMTGMHNLTLRSLTALEVALDGDVITVPNTEFEIGRTYITIGMRGQQKAKAAKSLPLPGGEASYALAA